MGLGRSRSCSWIVEIADVGAASLTAMRKQVEGARGDGRHPDSTISSSFDEAAVKAGLALSSKGARHRVSEAGRRPSPWPNTPQGGSDVPERLSIKSPTGPGGAGPIGKPRDVEGHAEAGGSPSSEAPPEVTSFAKASAGRAAVEAPSEVKAGEGVIRESSGPQGARVVTSVAEVG
jgi:hypothetical protein